jgi:Glycosyl transferases group 1
VTAEELIEHVGAADIYITPYRQEAQVVSGTLAIALGAGKAIISTPYWHAKELLAEKRGVIVPFESPDAIAQAVNTSLQNDAECHAMRKRAYLHSRGTTWEKTARAYMGSSQRARFERTLKPKAAQTDDHSAAPVGCLPVLNTGHFMTMTTTLACCSTRSTRYLNASDGAVEHGKIRHSQGYTIPMIIEESRMLQVSIFHTLQSNLKVVDFSLLLIDVMTIADEVDSQLKQTIVSFSESSAVNIAAIAAPALA